MRALIGGYTANSSQGIYELTIDKQVEVRPFLEINGPTYFQVDGDFLLTIKKGDGIGGLALYDLKSKQLIDEDLVAGASPCYVGLNRQAKIVYTANYHTGLCQSYHYDQTGLKPLLKIKHTAETLGPKKEQDSAHPHFFDETPAGNLVVCDLGNDSVTFYDQSGKKLARYQNHPGFGSRHIRFNGQYFYVVGELASEINVVKFDETSWQFEDLGYYSTLIDQEVENGAAALYLDKTKQFLYCSNRGANTISVFKINGEKLELIQSISTNGTFPRDFNWDRTETHVLVANQTSDNATLYSRNPQTGMLTPKVKDISVPEGTRVEFF
ncbi:MAG: lactonase family protein [Lactobacillus sp.]|nr:lactonase family protein [Lactobacillus sp.]